MTIELQVGHSLEHQGGPADAQLLWIAHAGINSKFSCSLLFQNRVKPTFKAFDFNGERAENSCRNKKKYSYGVKNHFMTKKYSLD